MEGVMAVHQIQPVDLLPSMVRKWLDPAAGRAPILLHLIPAITPPHSPALRRRRPDKEEALLSRAPAFRRPRRERAILACEAHAAGAWASTSLAHGRRSVER